MTASANDIKAHVEALAHRRDVERKANVAMQKATAKFHEETADLFRQQMEATKLRREMEQVVRDEARLEFLSSGDKNPGPGVSIRLNKRLEYDERIALQYAKDTHTFVLLDKKAFEQSAPDLGLDFVQVVTDPTVCISSDLFSVLHTDPEGLR